MPSLQFGQSLLHYRFLHSISVTNTDSLMNAQPSSSLNPQEKKISDFSLWTLFLLDEIFSTCSYFPQNINVQRSLCLSMGSSPQSEQMLAATLLFSAFMSTILCIILALLGS